MSSIKCLRRTSKDAGYCIVVSQISLMSYFFSDIVGNTSMSLLRRSSRSVRLELSAALRLISFRTIVRGST